jgi:GTP-binding protein HflX
MFERPQGGERAVLVHLDLGLPEDAEDLGEFRLLATAAGAEPIGVVRGSRQAPDPRFFVGTGKVEELRALLSAEQAELVLVDHELSPSQERNLERALECRVIDRTGLILDIFAQRARSFEGKLQVELAQLRHLATRLVRGWTHLERQKGGIGLRGPGETQLETDRRLVGQRITLLKRRLQRVAAQRAQGRRARSRNLVPTVSVVGYTNAGKSTLFNQLTESGVFAADQLFATLDSTLRRLDLPHGGHAVLADTVGFIRKLPHDLVAAFRSTLEETSSAALLLHVVDAAAPGTAQRIAEVERVLAEIGADTVPCLQVFNKIDAMDGGRPRIERGEDGRVRRVWVSARTGLGMGLLREAIGEHLHHEYVRRRLRLSPRDGRLRARLFQAGRVMEDHCTDDGGWVLEVEFPRPDYERLLRQEVDLERRVLGDELASAMEGP